MCGICGSLSLDAGPIDRAGVERMNAALEHRGPDAAGLLVRPGLVAGIRRLAVIDVHGGDQPIANEDGTVHVVFNGEIYNHAELRAELESAGHRFRTRSDTEVLVHLWERDGPRLVERLNGMFAFCIHDDRTRETFIARDRLGIKPLYWARDKERLVFASEIAALRRHPGLRPEVDLGALIELYCLQYLTGERTLFRGVHKLLPGHALHVRSGDVRLSRYWRPPEAPLEAGPSLATRTAELESLLDSSVRYQRVADVPVGVFLSGGLDSAALVSLLARAGGGPIKTFSVGFEGSPSHDERRHARAVARRFGTEHHELLLSPVPIAQRLPGLIEHLEEPVTDPALIPTYLLAGFARDKVKVVLTGEGADELFAGYRRYAYQERYGWLARVPALAHAGGAALSGLVAGRAVQGLRAAAEADPARNHLQWSFALDRALASRLFGEAAFREQEERMVAAFVPYFRAGRPCLADQLRADRGEWLPHNLLAKVDRATMAVSLEARVPYLDHRLVEWAAGLPEERLLRGGTSKLVLRETFRPHLPADILERPKQGFDLPLDAWIRGPLREIAIDLLAPSRLARWDGLDARRAASLLRLHLSGRRDFGLALFNLVSIVLFLERIQGQAA